MIREMSLWEKDFVAYRNLPCRRRETFLWRVYHDSFCSTLNWIGFGVHESFKEPSEISKPYGAMISVVKAAEHFHAEFKARLGQGSSITEDISENPTQLHFVRPVVVLDGVLLSACLGNDGNLHIEETAMAPMYVGYRSAEYEGDRYRVDLVQLDAFDRYLRLAEVQHNALRAAVLDYGGLRGLSEAELISGAKPDKARISSVPK